MKPTKYKVHFQDGTERTVEAYYMAAALILAQAEQLKSKKTIIPIKVDEYSTQTKYVSYHPVYQFRAHKLTSRSRLNKLNQTKIEV